MSLPFSSATTARVPPVPTSIPRNHIAGNSPLLNRFSAAEKRIAVLAQRGERQKPPLKEAQLRLEPCIRRVYGNNLSHLPSLRSLLCLLRKLRQLSRLPGFHPNTSRTVPKH